MVSRRGGGARRPPIRKVASARLSKRVPRRPPVIVRPEGIRWLRADGTPEWISMRAPQEGEVKLVASSPAVVVSSSSNILEAAETMAKHKVRGLPIVSAGSEKLAGIVTSLDLVNYLGGGEYYNIVVNRHKMNIYSALRDEPLMSIANPTPSYVTVEDKLTDVINLMITTGVGIIPVTWPDGAVYGVVTEHDIVKHMAGKEIGIRVGDIATKTIVTIDIEATIKKAAERMVTHGFRRLPVYNPHDETLKGMLHAKDIVSFFGSHEAFKNLTSTSIEEALQTPVYELMRPGIYTIHEDVDVGVAAKEMIDKGVNSLLVEDETGQIIGIITERDILEALVMGP